MKRKKWIGECRCPEKPLWLFCQAKAMTAPYRWCEICGAVVTWRPLERSDSSGLVGRHAERVASKSADKLNSEAEPLADQEVSSAEALAAKWEIEAAEFDHLAEFDDGLETEHEAKLLRDTAAICRRHASEIRGALPTPQSDTEEGDECRRCGSEATPVPSGAYYCENCWSLVGTRSRTERSGSANDQ